MKHFWKLLALGVMLSLAVPAQGLGSSDFKGPSILTTMEAEYWQVSLIIGTLYTIFMTIFHFGWKLQDYLYLKELNEKKDRLIRELGLLAVRDETCDDSLTENVSVHDNEQPSNPKILSENKHE